MRKPTCATQVAGWLRAVRRRAMPPPIAPLPRATAVYADRLGEIRCPLLVLTGDGDANSTPR
jgi:pimeloyl-ACP methyl ester carboxylesterase